MDNINRIKPAFRTTGRVSGNFGKNKVKAGSSLNDLTDGNVGSLPTKLQWFHTLLSAYNELPERNRPGIQQQLVSLSQLLHTQHILIDHGILWNTNG